MGKWLGVDPGGVWRLIGLAVLSLSMIVQADLEWLVTPENLSLIVYETGDSPADELFTLSNSGDTPLYWIIYDVNETTLSLPDWLNVVPTSGSVGAGQSSYMILQTSSSGLSGGIYEYSFDVVDSIGGNRQKIDILLEVIGPSLEVSTDSFVFPFNETNFDTEQTLTIQNTGGGVLEWSIHDPSGLILTIPDWLTLDTLSGSLAHDETADVLLTVDPADLTNGQHIFEFEVSTADTQNSPVLITVQVNISEIIYVPGDFGTIQEAINAADTNDRIVVMSGLYMENLDFNGKDIVLMSLSSYDPDVSEPTYINGGGQGAVVTFNGKETSACVLRGFVLYNGYNSGAGGGICGSGTLARIDECIIAANAASWAGGICGCNGTITNCLIVSNAAYYDGGGMAICDGTIVNCTIASNIAGDNGGGLFDCLASIKNCIIWNNEATGVRGVYEGSIPTYSCIQDWAEGGTGNIDLNPLFADPGNDDYHLKSAYGRWDPNSTEWVGDSVTSPCIDSGQIEWIAFTDNNGTPTDPNDDFEVYYADPNGGWTAELWPHGQRVNMGFYGATAQASMSGDPRGNLANLNHDTLIDSDDLMLLVESWLLVRDLMDVDLDRDGDVDYGDFSLFSEQWLSPMELQPPPAPTGLTLTAGELEVLLDWDDSNYEYFGSFNVYRAVNDPNSFELVATALNESAYIDPNLCDGNSYYYVVTVQSTFDSESEYSEMVSVVFEGPPAPSGLAALTYEDYVELDWDDSEYPYWASYNIYRSEDPNTLELLDTAVMNSAYVDESVIGGKTYYYAVSVISECGSESVYSEVAFASPPYTLFDHFEGSLGNWSNVDYDDADWERHSGTTPSSGTGPSSGAEGSTWYVYVEGGYVASAGKVAILEGPEINGFNREMTFYYHMYGEHMGTLNVDVYSDGIWNEGVWSLSGQQQTSSEEDYQLATVDLSGYTGLITIRFRFVSIGGYATDIAVDQISISGVQ